MDDNTDVPGGAQTVCRWIEMLEEADRPEKLWWSLDANLQLVLAQQWLFGPGSQHSSHDEGSRDVLAEELSSSTSHELFEPMIRDYIAHWREVYRDLDYRPALVMTPDLAGVDLEVVSVTSDHYAGTKAAGESAPGHTFLTRWVDGQWKIAAHSRRIPVPGWPPTEEEIPASAFHD